MKTACLFVASALVLAQPQRAVAWQAISHCYKILVDGKDRSAYQYVNDKLVTFADPEWEQDPTVDEAHLVDSRTGKEEKAPFIQRANYTPSRPWGGVMFEHIPFGKTLTLRIGSTHVTLKRTDFDVACPHPDYRLDNRQNGYEVLQYSPSDEYSGPLGSLIHLEGQQVILRTTQLFTECSATIIRAGEGKSEPFPIHIAGGSHLSELYPHLSQVIRNEWGLLYAYLLFPSLNPGDEVKVTVSIKGESPQSPFYVRKIN